MWFVLFIFEEVIALLVSTELEINNLLENWFLIQLYHPLNPCINSQKKDRFYIHADRLQDAKWTSVNF